MVKYIDDINFVGFTYIMDILPIVDVLVGCVVVEFVVVEVFSGEVIQKDVCSGVPDIIVVNKVDRCISKEVAVLDIEFEKASAETVGRIDDDDDDDVDDDDDDDDDDTICVVDAKSVGYDSFDMFRNDEVSVWDEVGDVTRFDMDTELLNKDGVVSWDAGLIGHPSSSKRIAICCAMSREQSVHT